MKIIKQQGVTLLELMVVLSVVAILLTAGNSFFSSGIANNRAVIEANSMVSAFKLARSEAVNKLSTVTVCARTTDTTCGTSGDWVSGWIVFIDNGTTGILEAVDVPIRIFPPLTTTLAITAKNSNSSIQFLPSGMVSNAGKFELTNSTGIQTRCVRISIAGQTVVDTGICP